MEPIARIAWIMSLCVLNVFLCVFVDYVPVSYRAEHYPGTSTEFLDIGNIHTMRTSVDRLHGMLHATDEVRAIINPRRHYHMRSRLRAVHGN